MTGRDACPTILQRIHPSNFLTTCFVYIPA
jgi:hypothetical protein